jgi:hypothetical protein
MITADFTNSFVFPKYSLPRRTKQMKELGSTRNNLETMGFR